MSNSNERTKTATPSTKAVAAAAKKWAQSPAGRAAVSHSQAVAMRATARLRQERRVRPESLAEAVTL